MVEQEDDRRSADTEDTSTGLTLIFPFVEVTPQFVLWFTVAMIVLSIAVLTNSTVHFYKAS